MAHGAVAAGWVQQEAPQPRAPLTVAGCARAPDALPDFTPRPMLLAALIVTDPLGESLQP